MLRRRPAYSVFSSLSRLSRLHKEDFPRKASRTPPPPHPLPCSVRSEPRAQDFFTIVLKSGQTWRAIYFRRSWIISEEFFLGRRRGGFHRSSGAKIRPPNTESQYSQGGPTGLPIVWEYINILDPPYRGISTEDVQVVTRGGQDEPCISRSLSSSPSQIQFSIL